MISTTAASIEHRFSEALHSHQQGKLKRAEAIYRKILKKQPNNDEALHLLGVLLHQTGRSVLAEHFINRAISQDPTSHIYLFNLAEVQGATGATDAAIRHYQQAITLSPEEADYYFGLGNAFYEQRQWMPAAEAFERAVQLTPEDPQIQANLGNALVECGQLEKAIDCFRNAVVLEPGSADFHYNLATALDDFGAIDGAIENYQYAISLDSGMVIAYSRLARLLRDHGDYYSAIHYYQKLLKLDTGNARVTSMLGDCYAKLDRYDEAIELLNKALALDVNNAEAHFNLGICLQATGYFEEAESAHRRALSIKPELTEAVYNLSLISSQSLSDEELGLLGKQADEEVVDANVKANIRFTLAKAYHDRHRFDEAFHQLKLGNEIKADLNRFDPSVYEKYIDRIIATTDASFFSARDQFGVQSKLPIFIVGMPRSGSTLVEQILASHPQVYGAGELNDMRILSKRLPQLLDSDSDDPEVLTEISAEMSKNLASEHLARLTELSSDADYVCDKMLGNFLKLGLIFLMFPRARIVHCRRNPLDTGLSCYFQNFARGLRFTYRLEHFGRAYLGYQKLMDHWRRVLPLPMFEIQYENLVSDQKQVSRQLIDFCGLPWDDQCLEFHRQTRGVKTASFWQVRQPLYHSSVNRWQQYQDQLQPLIEILGSPVDEAHYARQ